MKPLHARQEAACSLNTGSPSHPCCSESCGQRRSTTNGQAPGACVRFAILTLHNLRGLLPPNIAPVATFTIRRLYQNHRLSGHATHRTHTKRPRNASDAGVTNLHLMDAPYHGLYSDFVPFSLRARLAAEAIIPPLHDDPALSIYSSRIAIVVPGLTCGRV